MKRSYASFTDILTLISPFSKLLACCYNALFACCYCVLLLFGKRFINTLFLVLYSLALLCIVFILFKLCCFRFVKVY